MLLTAGLAVDKDVLDGKLTETVRALTESARYDFGGAMLFRAMLTLDVP